MDNLNEVVEKIKTNVNSGIISSENDAIQYLIQPFLTLLGYDFSNPSQVRREEYVETLKDRVDFILTTSSGLKIAVEAENADVDLTKGTSGDAQARRYFNNGLDFKLSISTNGLVYNFFADIEANNHAD